MTKAAVPNPSGSLGWNPAASQQTILRLARRERWLNASSLAVLLLCAMAWAAYGLPLAEPARILRWQIPADQAAPALLGLVLLSLASSAYQRGKIAREKRALSGDTSLTFDKQTEAADGAAGEIDPITGLCTRKGVEHQLGKELARIRRSGKPLSLLLVNLDDFEDLKRRRGSAAVNRVLQEFAHQLKHATRGTDLPARMGPEEFIIVLPECPPGCVQHVLERISPVEVNCSGERVSPTYSTSCIDYQKGESLQDLIGRADQMLRLYRTAAGSTPSAGPH